METVVLSTIAVRASIHLVDRIFDATAKRASSKTTKSDEHTSTEEQEVNDDMNDDKTEIQDSTQPVSKEALVVDENSVSSLEAKIKDLRSQATQLTSADTFVQYARVTREANRLEKRLKELKGSDKPDDIIDFDRIANAMSTAITGRAAQSTQHWMTARTILKGIIRVLVVVSLWWRFSYGRQGQMRGQVMQFDCQMVRPISWIFRRQGNSCVKDDWTCAMADSKCSVSFVMATALCNAGLSLLTEAVAAMW